MKKRQIITRFLIVLTVFIVGMSLQSCRIAENERNGENDAKFLWFIPVDTNSTGLMSLFEIIAFVGAILFKKFGHGWSSTEITRDIRDTRGNLIGTVETGKYKHTYTSPEEAANIATWIRLVAVVCLTLGAVISWIIPMNGSFWWVLLYLALSAYCIFKARTNETFGSLVWLWEKVFVVICAICLFVYSIW